MRNVRITAVGGIGYNNQYYNLSAMIVVGYNLTRIERYDLENGPPK